MVRKKINIKYVLAPQKKTQSPKIYFATNYLFLNGKIHYRRSIKSIREGQLQGLEQKKPPKTPTLRKKLRLTKNIINIPHLTSSKCLPPTINATIIMPINLSKGKREPSPKRKLLSSELT